MEGASVIWGLVILAAGVFVSVYGSLLFRFVLAVVGFAIGFYATMTLLPATNTALQVLIALIVGGIGAAVLYSLFRISLHIAGALLGAVIVMAVLSLIGWVGGGSMGVVSWILVLAGAGVVGFLGNRLGNAIIPLATALTGAALVVLGFSKLFAPNVGAASNDPIAVLSGGFGFVLFLVLAIISALAQFQITDLRRRLLR
ncbi:MAG: TMEM198/TM7SF3 family protein [Anaerolineae bacterium]|jgi:hypothetical protein|nr:TMEM198/TM7SF3 family protein [Anaerolineae bacterium]